MHDENFRGRALAFAAGAGSVVLILALLATDVAEKIDSGTASGMARALDAIMLSVIAAAVTAVATLRALEPIARALDAVLDALRTAAGGVLDIGFGQAATTVLPHLVASLEVLLRQVRSSIDNIRKLALHDPVTDLPNRLHFRQLVDQHFDAGDPAPAVLLFVDLDRFKSVNDSLGHAQGDALLGLFAARLRVLFEVDRARRSAASAPIVARLAGDEFTIFVPGIVGSDEAERQGRLVLQALEAPFDLAGQAVVISASVGVAHAPRDGGDYDTLMRNADAAMYHAKALGRNQCCAYTPELTRKARDRLRLETRLRQALSERQFELFFQPQARAGSGDLFAAEALIRWRDPEFGLRLPASFMDVAEDAGLIVEIGRWMLGEAVRTAADWAAAGIDCRISFNVSPREVMHPEFVARVRACLEAHDVSPERLEMEITESLVMSSDAEMIDKLAQLRALGLTVAIDDFGTGYSNLARLKTLPIDRLKIDRTLVQDVAFSADARTIINAIVSLSHGLGYECVAEGVETPLQAKILGIIGCELLQGYAIGKPMPEPAFRAWIETRRCEAPHAEVPGRG